MVTENSAPDAQTVSIVIRPNRSLPVAGMVALFVALSSVALAIGIGFSLVGAWLIMPFTGLEVAVVGALCYWLYRHIDDCELVVIAKDEVRITRRIAGKESSEVFPRYWARVKVEPGRSARYPSRLHIGSHGRFTEIAAALTEGDRRNLARDLRAALRRQATRGRT